MREIKFRAWDRLRNRMSESFNLDCLHYGYFIDKEGTLEASTFYLCDCEIVQYTGLKSKNGKEIYEGDIIRYTFHIGPREWPGIVHEVEWSDSNLTGFHPFIDYDVDADGNECCVIPDSIEVIGNIYENPELLKK